MKFTVGLETNTGAIDQKPGSWRDGRNMIISKQFGAAANEEGFDVVIEMDGDIIGNIVLDTNLVAIFQIKDSNSEIYIVDLVAKTKRLITSNNIFEFNSSFPITGEYYRNSKGQIIIGWTDNNRPPRIMNIEIDYTGVIDKLTRVYQLFNLPILEDYNIQDTGGALVSGAYWIATAYESIDQSDTPYGKALGPFYITSSGIADIGDDYTGVIAGTATSKSIRVTLTNVDTDYKFLYIALVSKIDGIITSKLVKKIPIESSTITQTITGAEDLGVVAIEEIINNIDVFSKVESMTQLQNQLIMANLTKDEEINYQLLALNIVVNYDHTLMDITANDNTNPKLNPIRGLMHNEIYMLNIHYVKDDGTFTKGFHIAGRAKAVYGNSDFPEFVGIQEDSSVDVAIGDHIARATSIGGVNSKIFQFFDTADNPFADTNMQFFQNETITYPIDDSFGSLQGQPVRHHKMPALSHIKSKYYPSDDSFGSSKLSRLKLVLSNVTLPENCIGYFISVGKRDFNDSTILAQDLMLYAVRKSTNIVGGRVLWTSSGNWRSFDELNTPAFMTPDPNYLRLHSFDLFLDRPNIAPNYVESEIVLRNRDVSIKYNFTTKTGGDILNSGGNFGSDINTLDGITLTDDQKRQDIFRLDYVKGNVATLASFPKKRFSRASEFKYMPANVDDLGTATNVLAEESALLKLDNGELYGWNGLTVSTSDDHKNKTDKHVYFGVGTSGLPEELSYLYNIKQYKADIYADMFTHDLFLLNTEMVIPTESDTIEGGDVLVSDMSFWTYGPRDSQDMNPSQGIRVARRHIVESVNFPSFRYQQAGDATSQFYPETDVIFMLNISRDTAYNKWRYNKDYTSVNDINFLEVNDPIANLNLVDDFPYRIIRSKIDQAEETGINNWRTFPVNDYYEMPKARGPIFNIKGAGDDLIINQKYALFRTRNKIKMATSEGEVIAGTGDIFELPPEEMLPTQEGYAGCQHKFSCLLTKNGYLFIDAEQGKIFILPNADNSYTRLRLSEISLKGNNLYFFNNLAEPNDNPYTTTGFTVGYDVKYDRLIISRKGNFTLSFTFDIEGGAWAFYHDYNPDAMFSTRLGLYSIKDNVIYRNNSDTKKGIYYGDTIYPSYIVPVFNEPPGVVKYFFNLKWRAEVRKLDDSNQRNESLTNLFIWDSYQATDEINLSRFLIPSLDDYNTRKSAGTWHFNKFRDLVIDNTIPFESNSLPITGNIDANKSLQFKRRFIDNYLLVKFQYDNQPIDGEQRNLYLYEVDCDVKPAER